MSKLRLTISTFVIFSLIFISAASAEVQYIEGYSLDGISKVTPTAGEVAAGVIHKYTNDDVIIYIAEDSIRFTAKTDSGNAWVQYDFNNHSSVQPSINASEKSATWESIYNNVDVKYTLIPGGLKQEIIVSDTPPATKFRELITVSEGLTLEKQNGEWTFFKDGIRVFSLQKPYAVDANETEFSLDLTKSIEGTSMYLEIDASSALESCVYPLVIDPTTYSGGYLSFWGLDVYDLPTLYSVTNNSSYISYDAPNVTYTFHVPVYQNNSAHVMSMDNATILLKSNNDGAPAYIYWAGHTDFSDLNVFGWDTVAGDYRDVADATSARIYSNALATGDITRCNMSYLGCNAATYYYGVFLNSMTGATVSDSEFTNNCFALYLKTCSDSVIDNCTIAGTLGLYLDNCDNITVTDCDCEATLTSAALYLKTATNCTLTNCAAVAPNDEYGIYLNNADNNTFTNCTGNSSSSYGIYVYSDSTGNEFNYCDGISGTNRGAYLLTNANNNIFSYCNFTSTSSYGINFESSNSIALNNCIVSGGVRGTRSLNADNITLTNHTSYGSSYNYSITSDSTETFIINSNNDVFTAEMGDIGSQITIRNTDGQLFNETATATAYSYQNGTFQMYETGTAETFTVTQYDSFLDSTTANSTVLGVPHATSSINVTSGTLNSWISSNLTPSAYYELLTGGTTLGFIYADTGGNVTVTDDLTTGVYYLTPAVTYNVSGYVFDENSTGISGATVTFTGHDTVTSNATGYYSVLAFYNGTYNVETQAYGYYTNDTSLTVDGADPTFNITMETNEEIYQAYMPWQAYLLLLVLLVGMIFYSFTVIDNAYYTDIITSLVSCVLAFILAHSSIIGIGYSYALYNTVEHEHYSIIPLGIILGVIGIIMLIFFIIKILELAHQEVEEFDI